MHDHLTLSDGNRIHTACYKCQHDHIHMEFANLAMTFTVEQFLAVSDLVSQMRAQLRDEAANRSIPEDSVQSPAALVM